jgi:allantoinase
LSEEFGVRIHIVHLSSTDDIAALRKSKSTSGKVSIETCPHYLIFEAEQIVDCATEFKCAPPIREYKNRERLWAALGDGTIDLVATDHSPCPPGMKLPADGDFLRAWGGIASLQLSLPAVWTEARSRGYSLSHIAGWMCAGPARLAGLETRKGAIAPGRDADLVIFDPDTRFQVDAQHLQHRHKLTPYNGRELLGVVRATFLRGVRVFEDGNFPVTPAGQVLLRGQI